MTDRSIFTLPPKYKFCNSIGYEIELRAETEDDARSQLRGLVAEHFPNRDASEWILAE